jgi:hypothetical protein
MNTTANLSLKTLSCLVAAACLLPTAADAQGSKALEGTWDVTVTIQACDTGASIRSFGRLITFHRGGTLTEWAASGSEAAPVSRSVGQGAWEYLGAQGFSYSLKFLRMTAFGGADGFVSELWSLDVDRSGESYSADGTAHINLANGIVVGPLCVTESGAKLF